MKGLERITQRIQTDAQGQIEALTAAGRRQAQEITEKYEDQARQLRQMAKARAVSFIIKLFRYALHGEPPCGSSLHYQR